MKKIVRLTESDLHRIVKESVKRVLREDNINGYEDGGELFNTAWDNFWSQFDQNRQSINWDVYEMYKGNPEKIKQWFEKHNIDYNDYF